ncbi:MAG: hypothetical protein C5B49_09565 [Bdellovibrio sp.]|nr:MAG: hypothetical protein C5B49_09565 [Bdellovibrio sp.]
MRQRLINGLYWLCLCLFSSLAFGSADNHLAELKSKFPYGILGDDHGILTMDDLALNACDAKPELFVPTGRSRPYQYWQCFENKTVSFGCDSDHVPDEREGLMGLIIVKASVHGARHEYIARRFWPIGDCKRFIRDAASLLKGTKYACISGSFIENEKDRSGRSSISWTFERIKTKKGCEGNGCEFTNEFRRDNCPNFKF